MATSSAVLRDLESMASGGVREGQPGDAVDGVIPRFVAAPASVEEAAALLQLANESALAVIPRGGGSKLGWGASPVRADLMLDMRRLDRVLEHAAGDLVVTVQAGAPLHSVQQTAASAGQRLSLDPPEPGATVGGVIAANASGPLRMRFGTIRDLLIGVTFLLADGTRARSGGKVVKNVAGYDLGKLLTGSFGTLALIVEAIMRLHPLPESSATAVTHVRTAVDVLESTQRILNTPLVPSALDVTWEGGRWLLAARFEGVVPGVKAQCADATRIWRENGEVEALEGDDEVALWDRLRLRPWESSDLGLKISLPIAALPAMFDAVIGLSDGVDVTPRIVGHAGSGVGYIAFADVTESSATALLTEIRARAVAAGGAAVVLQAPLDIKAHLDVWGPFGDALPLMRRVRHRFDPAGIMNPGRLLGGES